MWFVRTIKPEAAVAVRIGERLAARKRGELLDLLRPCFARPEPWLQARKYLSVLASGMARRNGWTIAEHAGDETPDKTQRLLNRAVWDTAAATGVIRRFAVAGLAGAAAVRPPDLEFRSKGQLAIDITAEVLADGICFDFLRTKDL